MARFVDALRWIALNDNDAELDVSVVEESVTVLMVADLWRKSAFLIAHDVVQMRRLRDAGNMKAIFGFTPSYNPTAP